MIEHFFSLCCITLVLVVVVYTLKHSAQKDRNLRFKNIQEFIQTPAIELDNQFHRALLSDMLDIYYPEQYDNNRALIATVQKYNEEKIRSLITTSYLNQQLTGKKIIDLLAMYGKFLLVYIIVMLITYYGVQTGGVMMFVMHKSKQMQKKPSTQNVQRGTNTILSVLKNALYSIGKAVLYIILFSPAYVISYSLKTELPTDSLFFMILLAAVSNGLLIMYSQKFYSFLLHESRKGYVETARVKNLQTSYDCTMQPQFRLLSLLRIQKRFNEHIFEHIYKNAQYQYMATIKEQSTFLITGLIIIEMALNIHGNMNYELLQQLLYKNYDIVAFIIGMIFITVKTVEILVDVVLEMKKIKYGNINHRLV